MKKKLTQTRAHIKKDNKHHLFPQILDWIDHYLLVLLSGFLLAFIPLYPKLPLFDIIPGYIVRVRVEDILILATVVLWLVQLFRGKAVWQTKLTKIILMYALVGFLSTLSGIIITQTIPFDIWHVGKSLLHYLRYLEYFSLFFITQSAVRSKEDAWLLLQVIVITTLGITVYGFGQRYLYWPVYSTMNREFSKGIRLVLDENARIQSTFAGHYDLGAYLVITLPLVLALMFSTTNKVAKSSYGFVLFSGILLLILNASRSSFGGFIIAITLVTLCYSLLQHNWKQRLVWFSINYASLMTVVLILSLYFGQSITERLLQTAQGYPAIASTIDHLTEQRKTVLNETLPRFFGRSEPISLSLPIERPAHSLTTSEAAVLIASDTMPKPAKKPTDVYIDVPTPVEVATISATGEATTITVYQERTYSKNAEIHGLSLAIRLDTLWPRAIAGFTKNPLLGSGYATLTKASVYEFTEAESTDNNFLRTLGETGLLGFVSFYGAIGIILYTAYTVIRVKTENTQQFLLAVVIFSVTTGLLFNAVYIDVFAASKIAFTYWSIVGLSLAVLTQSKPTPFSLKKLWSYLRNTL